MSESRVKVQSYVVQSNTCDYCPAERSVTEGAHLHCMSGIDFKNDCLVNVPANSKCKNRPAGNSSAFPFSCKQLAA